MHRQLRTHLDDATGKSDLVLAVFLDVRGFSTFARMAESSEAALFLRSMYISILDEYFPGASFFKPTGDGLMIIRHYDRESLQVVVNDSVDRSLRLVANFASLCSDDPMVNFEVPASLGVGIARGAATGLVSGEFTIDYSGRPLNLAARLMDLARPGGVVLAASVLKGLSLPPDLAGQFENEEAYVKGISELAPLGILRSREVVIPPINRRPLVGKPFDDPITSRSFSEIEGLGRFLHTPTQEPLDADEVRLRLRFPQVDKHGNKHRTNYRVLTVEPVSANRTPTGWEIVFDYTSVVSSMKELGVKGTWEVKRTLRYSVADTAGSASSDEEPPF